MLQIPEKEKTIKNLFQISPKEYGNTEEIEVKILTQETPKILQGKPDRIRKYFQVSPEEYGPQQKEIAIKNKGFSFLWLIFYFIGAVMSVITMLSILTYFLGIK